MAASKEKTSATERELVITRVFDAPRELVFKAWTDPKRLAQWWGPRGFTNPVCELDVRPGGALRIHMRGPNGVVYPMRGVFREIVEPAQLSFTFTAEDAAGNALLEGLTTVTFAIDGDKTKLTVQTRAVAKVAHAVAHLDGMEAGWTQSLGRLGEHVTSASDREIVITRVFDSPRELVFQAWTDAKRVAQWWGPKGFTTTTHEMDVRPGGVWRFVMHGPDGVDYNNKIVYHEVVKPERLAYTHSGDEDLEFRVTVIFAEQDGKTRLTLRSVFASAAERDRVVKEHNAIEGGNQTLDRFGEYLATKA
jgi:uncharacterized protein YndB with AHSA1/START domain